MDKPSRSRTEYVDLLTNVLLYSERLSLFSTSNKYSSSESIGILGDLRMNSELRNGLVILRERMKTVLAHRRG